MSITAGKRRIDRDGRRLGLLMIGLPTIGLLALIVGPLVYSFVLSGFSWRITDINSDKPFVGIDNYVTLFTDPLVLTALGNTILYVIGSVGTELLLGFAVAVALFDITRGRRLANSLILLADDRRAGHHRTPLALPARSAVRTRCAAHARRRGQRRHRLARRAGSWPCPR